MPLPHVITLEHMDVGRCDAQRTRIVTPRDVSATSKKEAVLPEKTEECEAGDMKKVSNELPMSISEVTHQIGI